MVGWGRVLLIVVRGSDRGSQRVQANLTHWRPEGHGIDLVFVQEAAHFADAVGALTAPHADSRVPFDIVDGRLSFGNHLLHPLLSDVFTTTEIVGHWFTSSGTSHGCR